MIRYVLLIVSFLFLSAKPISGQFGGFPAASWNPVDETIAVSDGYSVWIYDESFELLKSFTMFERNSTSGNVYDVYMDWSPDGQLLAVHTVGDVDSNRNSSRLLQVWDISSMMLLSEFRNIKAPISLSGRQFTWQPESTSLVAVYFYDVNVNAQTLNQYDAISGEISAEWMPGKVFGRIEEPVWFPDGSKIVMFINGQLEIWDAETKSSIFTLPEPVFFEVRPQFSPDGQYVAFVNVESPYEIQIWHAEPFEYSHSIPGIDTYIGGLNWTTQGLHVDYYSGENIIWNPDTLTMQSQFNIGNFYVIDWNPDGTKFIAATITGDAQIYVGDALTGEILATLPANSQSK